MKIAIIELDYHSNVLNGLCHILEAGNDEITIFTNQFNFDDIKHNEYVKRFRWIIDKENQYRKFLVQHIPEINAHELVIINTSGHTYDGFAKLNYKPVTILRVHNAFTLFDPFHHIHIPVNLFNIWKGASYFVREIVFKRYFHFRKMLLKKIDYFSFLDDSITKFVLAEKLFPADRIALTIPTEPYLKISDKKPEIKDFMRFTVPGIVDARRKNYWEVVEAIQLIVPELKHKMVLTILGNSNTKYGKKIINALKKEENDYLQIEYFIKKVPQQEYDNMMLNSDVIVSPVNITSTLQIYGEIYGKTKMSGSMTDIIRFPKASILPERFYLANGFEKFALRYKNAGELKDRIMYYLQNPGEAENVQHQFEKFLTVNYDKEIIYKNLKEDFQKLIVKGKVATEKMN